MVLSSRLVSRVLVVMAALFAAYVVGRAAGILLDVNPWATEAVALAGALVLLARLAMRR